VRSRKRRRAPWPIACDVRQAKRKPTPWVERVQRELGPLDHAARGRGRRRRGTVPQHHTAEYRQMVDVNILGMLYPIHAALPAMTKRGQGHVVIDLVRHRALHPPLGGLFRNQARSECDRRDPCGARSALDGIRVTAIEPGAVKTEFTSHMRADVRDAVARRLGDMEQLEAEDIAAAILYAVTQPRRVNVNILTLYPTQQA
jgi:NADP-dependent 3-hydroxy acid dehydrogenase YdfG